MKIRNGSWYPFVNVCRCAVVVSVIIEMLFLLYLAAGKGRERERKDGRLREDTKKEGQAGKAKASEVVS